MRLPLSLTQVMLFAVPDPDVSILHACITDIARATRHSRVFALLPRHDVSVPNYIFRALWTRR
jgi:hypothetical protein